MATDAEVVFEAPGPGPWQQDSAHCPHGFSPMGGALYPQNAMKGFAETFDRWGSLVDGLAWADVNGFPYHQPQFFDMPGPDGPKSEEYIGSEIGRRLGVATAAFENKIWRGVMDQWENELKPASIARHRELGDVELSELDDAALRAHLEACIDHLTAMAYQHHRFNCSAMVPVADFLLHAAQWVHQDPTKLLGAFDGHSPASGVVCPEIEPALEALRADAAARELLASDGDPAEALDRLRAAVPAVDEFVRSVGFRLLEGFDVNCLTAIERPDTILGRLRAALDANPEEARARADAFAADLRSRVPEEHRTEFDELLAEGRMMYRLRDERGIYSDISAWGLLRLALLEAGSRLTARGTLRSPEHTFELVPDELHALMDGAAAPTADEVAERAVTRAAIVAAGAPRHLGDPPPPPPPLYQLPPVLGRLMGALGFAIEGVLGEMEAPAGDDSTVVGIGAANGVYEGKVHLVHAFDDLFSIEQGDVLVSPATGEAFNAMLHLVGAIVTDHGGFACHAGIVARECGFPAVVGCVDATKRLQQGQRVRVDGASGEITVLA